ncbi:MAG: hypothetical protein HF981_25335 [Desulfobacteraceae bacterium]|jgi:hypothetical protein|nr:hypothetical protein [Desulfobacteraceae bacterium]MBC2753741.1 hypothetical protein [Desulfobacteraceae bacterium]
MALIKRSNIKDASLTILTVSGVVTCQDVIHALEDFFKNDVTPNLLWDYTDADVSEITEKCMNQIIAIAKSNAHLREKGRTAIVGRGDVTFGLSRMYEILSELREHPIQHHVFRNIDEAITWLKTDE